MLPSRSRTTAHRTAAVLLAAAVLAGCRTTGAGDEDLPPAADAVAARATGLFGPSWTLVLLDGAAPPPGAGGRPATLAFESVDGRDTRGSGHAGCNRWSSDASFIPPSGLHFTAPISTRMACVDGMDLERRFLGFVQRVHSFRVSGDTLTLSAEGGAVGRFVRR